MPSQTSLSSEELNRRKLVGINKETVTNTISTDYPGAHYGEEHAWDVNEFSQHLNIQFHQNDPSLASFSLIGVDASIANAFRRIMIAEIPSLAIERVFITNNTSVIQDEVLAQRLGLVPLKGSKEGLRKFMKPFKRTETGGFDNSFDFNTVNLRLNVKCTRNPDAKPGENDPNKAYIKPNVYASDIEFVPAGQQTDYFSGDGAIVPVNPDILIAKLRPGQGIDLEMHAHIGYGWDHAKFSPVCTASYRLMPIIDIVKPIVGADAEKFRDCFPDGVIRLQPVTAAEAKEKGSGYEGHKGEMKAVVNDPMRDTVSRECLRHAEFEGKVKLGRRRDHFIFSIESAGQWDSDELFLASIAELKSKCKKLEEQVLNMVR
ncbi:DNA-directed RNA polymerase I and III subunit RPAC1 [Pyricularia oryzae 70-15]|uniref:DNA-directed RNA polymerases I and III subunit RPAC1 n=3 Tax=Pyricularia oryzae TaxID=318829 RepID=G4MQN0_PYRO7|nr:DNA-directed RNA polymerase I and III subunit RPAC1 [Pyricularia oryzae 70-15]EHA57317.1 DNA-directed RNA polymerase I and III subunit RPAC1 [Pyricularia oryzae 70-15]ELQ40590.1 DNA-directed RNA polymerases I and III subunit RPAC1 [Pyricularia oryzae Y34]KAI7923201.1 DNA-directed RNA polymerase I and III subunit RPAC1 [Pyricularia oryzae]KAI7924119.1 DNA-directed RNA polymerase I and III subunit RPAC1 [Pyricularia oryzae]